MSKDNVVTDLRQLLIGKGVQYKTVPYDYKGTTVYFKQPSQRVRSNIFEKATKTGSDGKDKVDGIALQVWAVIYTLSSEDGKLVFSEHDFDRLMDEPAGGFVDTFAQQAVKVMGVEDEEGKVEEGGES